MFTTVQLQRVTKLNGQKIVLSGKVSIMKRYFSGNTNEQLKKTALYDLHIENGAKMVPFCGWEMPVQYSDLGIIDSHIHTRTKVSLFDVGHMAQLRITGKDRFKFLESLTVVDFSALPEGHAKLSVLTNEKGGIIDDTIITNRGSHIYMVVNAGCADKDIPHLQKHLEAFVKKGGDVHLAQMNRSLIALQGPLAEKTLQAFVKYDLSNMPFMTSQEMYVSGAPCLVSRTGYTGEDGFEISLCHEDAPELARLLLSKNDVKTAGLGARDTLRLEAGLCLYGNDLNEDITPVEASLAWLISKRRREEGGFLGSEKILEQLKNPASVTKKRVGLIVDGPPAREHCTIHHVDSNAQVGEVTSGTMSPILKKAISMAYVESSLSKVGTMVNIAVRGKQYPATVSKMPFVPTNYKKV